MPQDIAIDSNDKVYVSDVGVAHPDISYVSSVLESNSANLSCELGVEMP
jgi:hypothetical protein